MNLKSYDKCTRVLKMAELATAGLNLQGETNVLNIGVVDCTQGYHERILANLAFSIRKENGVPLNFSIENFDYLKRLSPATGKYARSYVDFVAKSTEAIIRTNLLDGVVAVIDNNVMGLGILHGCTKANCPVLLMPVGINPNYDENVLMMPGKVATREIKSTEIENAVNTCTKQFGTAADDTMSRAFFCMAESLGLILPNGSNLQVNTGATLDFALTTGIEAIKRADDIITPKRLINKKTVAEAVEKYQAQNYHASGLLQFSMLLNMVEVKLPSVYTPLKGSLANEAFVTAQDTAPLTIEGQAWVYHSLTDAVTALTSNAIDNGIIVLQNCLNCDVTIVLKTIIAMHKENDIAVITDGYACATKVLTIANITPTAFDNEEFANIQNGDMIEIDVTKGRLNTNVTSKDMKLRAKRNIVKKYEIYF